MLYVAMKKRGFGIVGLPPGLAPLMSQISVWHDFCNLDLALRRLFHWPHEKDGDYDPGFDFRHGEQDINPTRDRKQFFHYVPKLDCLIDRNSLRAEVNTNLAVRAFFDLAGLV